MSNAADELDVGNHRFFKDRFVDQLVANSRLQPIWEDEEDALMLAFPERRRITDRKTVEDLKGRELAVLAASLG